MARGMCPPGVHSAPDFSAHELTRVGMGCREGLRATQAPASCWGLQEGTPMSSGPSWGWVGPRVGLCVKGAPLLLPLGPTCSGIQTRM